jgi:membrane protein
MKPIKYFSKQWFAHLTRKALFWRPVRVLIHDIRKLVLPGFQGVPLFDVLSFFIRGLMRGSINNRAKALSFSFFLALFPMLLFMFTLLPYFPVHGLLEELYIYLQSILPNEVYKPVIETINEVFNHKHTTLLSVGFLATIVVSVNGMDSIVRAFNQSSNTIENRTYIRRKIICLFLVVILYLLVSTVLSIMLGFKRIVIYLLDSGLITNNIIFVIINIGRWILMIIMALVVISVIYYLAPVKKQRLGFFSAGSTLSTILFFMATAGFNFYISNFSKYNVLYGSIGTLIIFLLWLYLCSCILLIGYEINISIANSKIQKRLLKEEEKY